MENRRGQLTIFIIIALLFLAGVLVYFAVFNNKTISLGSSKSSDPFYVFADECVNNAVFSAIQRFGYQQGYYEVPERNSLETSIYRTAYYYKGGEIIIPENGFFESELSKFVNEEVSENCNDFSEFENDYLIRKGDVSSEISFLEEEILVEVNYPITISDNETSREFSEFDYEVPVRIGYILDVSRDLVDEIQREPTSIDLTKLLSYDLAVSVSDYDECNQIYLITDDKSVIFGEESYVFSFAVGFSEENCSGGLNA